MMNPSPGTPVAPGPRRVAIVHEWLSTWAGSEKVVAQWLAMYPQADLFCTVDFLPQAQRHLLAGRTPRTSFIQRLPGARRHFRHYLPLMPLAIEQHDLSDYDLVLSSNHAVAKGVVTGPDQLHLSYVHSPMRYAWDLQHQYLRESNLQRGWRGAAARAMLHYLRGWDARSANQVDAFAANSHFIAGRIRKAYRREATVIHPPVATDRFTPGTAKQDFYLAASRLVPYKRMPLIVEAFAQLPGQRLVMVGDGPEAERVRALARGLPNVELRGHVDDAEMVALMQQARAFVFAAEEDFGIAPVEAMACGTPVLALARGGSLDTVLDGRTGLFFHQQTADDIAACVRRFEAHPGELSATDCRQQAERFSEAAFRTRYAGWVEAQWQAHASGTPAQVAAKVAAQTAAQDLALAVPA